MSLGFEFLMDLVLGSLPSLPWPIPIPVPFVFRGVTFVCKLVMLLALVFKAYEFCGTIEPVEASIPTPALGTVVVVPGPALPGKLTGESEGGGARKLVDLEYGFVSRAGIV